MQKYLRGFVTVLCALSTVKTVSSRPLPELSASTSRDMADRVFAGADVDHDNRISFEEFGHWCVFLTGCWGGGGCYCCPVPFLVPGKPAYAWIHVLHCVSCLVPYAERVLCRQVQ